MTKKELGDVKSEVWGEILLQVLGKASKEGRKADRPTLSCSGAGQPAGSSLLTFQIALFDI